MTTQAGEGTEAQGENAEQSTNPDEGQKGKEPAGQVDELSRLREQNQRLKGQLTDTEKKYTQFASIYKDIDPDEAKALKTKLDEAERKAAATDPAKMEELYERKINKYRQEYEVKEHELVRELDRFKVENKSLRVTDRVMSEISPLFNKDALEFIKLKVETLCDLDEDGTIVVKNDRGEALFKDGKYVGIKDFGEMLVERYPSFAKPTGSGGGKDAAPGAKVPSRQSGRTPESWAELQQMPNAKEVLDRLRRENPAAVQKILSTMRA